MATSCNFSLVQVQVHFGYASTYSAYSAESAKYTTPRCTTYTRVHSTSEFIALIHCQLLHMMAEGTDLFQSNVFLCWQQTILETEGARGDQNMKNAPQCHLVFLYPNFDIRKKTFIFLEEFNSCSY